MIGHSARGCASWMCPECDLTWAPAGQSRVAEVLALAEVHNDVHHRGVPVAQVVPAGGGRRSSWPGWLGPARRRPPEAGADVPTLVTALQSSLLRAGSANRVGR